MIELQKVSLAFDGKPVLKDVSMKIPDVGVTALTGPSGCGKTTLLKVVAGLLEPDGGCITGRNGLKFSIVFQENRLMPWLTALENVSVVSNTDTALYWLAQLGLAHAVHQKPKALSGGMQRRVAIARALSYDGNMLLLDEPFNGLDDENRRLCAAVILSRNLPGLIITHHQNEAELLGAVQIATIQ